MKTKKSFPLIDGVFSTSEGKELLLTLYADKIQFHAMKNFSSNERFGKDDEYSVKRIPELKKCVESITAVIKEAEARNKNLVIKSVINITFSNPTE